MALTPNQLTDSFQSSYGRAPLPEEITKFQGAPLSQFSSAPDPTFALVANPAGGPSTVYNKTTGKAYASPQDFASAIGQDPNKLDWNSFKFDTSWQPSQQPYTAPPAAQTPTDGSGSGTTQTDPNTGLPTFNYTDTYNKSLSGLGADQALQNVKSLQDQITAIDNSINSALQQKIQQVQQSGGIVNEDELRGEVAQEQQALITQRNGYTQQLQYQTQDYNQILQQANAQVSAAEKTYTDQLATYKTLNPTGAQNQTTAAKALTDYLNAIKAGTLDPSTLDPSALAQIDQTLNLPMGTTAGILGVSGSASSGGSSSTTPTSAEAVNDPLGLKPGGTFSTFSTPTDGYQAGMAQIQSYMQGQGPVKSINANSTIDQFIKTWITGNPNSTTKTGYNAQNIATYLTNTLGIKGVTANTPLYQIGADNLAKAIAHFETGYNADTMTFDSAPPESFTSFYTSANAPDPSIANTVDPKTGVTPNSIFQNAIQYALDGTLPSFGNSATQAQVRAQKNALQNKAAALVAAAGTTYPELQAEYKANSGALATILPTFNQLAVNEQNATKNFALLTQLGQTMDANSYQSATPLINSWLRTGQVALGGNTAVNNFVSVLTTSMTEYAKVVTGQTSGAAVTDAANAEMQSLLNKGLSVAAIQDWITNAATPDMQNRSSSYLDQINSISSTIGSFLSTVTGVNPGQAASGGNGQGNSPQNVQTMPDGTKWQQNPDGSYTQVN